MRRVLTCSLMILLGTLFSAPSWARVSMGGPAVTYGQNVGRSKEIFAGGWGLFLGSQFRLGLGAYTFLNKYDPAGGTADHFKMFYGGPMIFYTVNPSLTAPVELLVGTSAGGGRASVVSPSASHWFWMVEPAVLALIRLNEWFAIGIDGRYRYVPDTKVGAYDFDNLSGFSLGLSLVFGSGDGK
jgi:hypothetical protein